MTDAPDAQQQPVPPQQEPYAQQQPYAQQPYAQQEPYAQQQPYAQQPYYAAQQYTVAVAAYAPPQPRGLSITSMVLGLASIIFGFTFLLPIGAVVFGAIGLKREPTGKGMSITGIILGGLCLLGWLIVVIVFIMLMTTLAGIAATVPAINN